MNPEHIQGLMRAVYWLGKVGNAMKYTGVLTIDGEGTFRYTLERVEQQPTAAAAPVTVNLPAVPIAATLGDVFTVLLIGHTMKAGIVGPGKARAGEPWERHTFRGSDNRAYSTFDSRVVSKLGPLVGQGTPVKIRGIKNQFGIDIREVLGS